MTKAEEEVLINTFKEFIVADTRIEIGLTVVKSPGIWISVAGEIAYLGESFESAMMTAQLSDWWIPHRDGNLLDDDREWFENRAKLGENWKEQELRMFKQERRIRLAHNIQLATRGELDNEEES